MIQTETSKAYCPKQRKFSITLRENNANPCTYKVDRKIFDTLKKYLEPFRSLQSQAKKIKCIETGQIFNSAREYERIRMPFHISDWWLFGLREDLNKYFLDTPLVKEPEFTNYFSLKENKFKKTPYGKTMFRFSPEQYFGYKCFSRNFDDIYMEDAADYSDKLMEKFRKCLVNNFIVLEFEQSGIYLNKYPYSKNEKFSGDQYIGLYNFHRYETEYKKYCDSNYQITTHSPLFDNEKLGYSLLRIYKHIAKFIDNETSIFQRLEQLFLGIPISTVNYLIAVIKESVWSKN